MNLSKSFGMFSWGFVLLSLGMLIFLNFVDRVYAPTSEANDTITIFVNVSKKTLVDINPSSLTWYDLQPGNEYNGSYEVNQYGNIWVENIGSVNITKIWFNNSFPSSRPFGTGNPLAYDPANFIVIANNSKATNQPASPYMYINRVEFEENDTLYIKVPNTSLSEIGVIFGRFRNGSREYFFEYVTGYPGNCSNGKFYINTSLDAAKTVASTGDVDLRDNTPIQFTEITINTGGGLQDGNVYDVGLISFGPNEKYCVFINATCGAENEKIYFVRWNADFLDDPAVQAQCPGLNGGYINQDPVFPGDFYKAWIKVRVPFGTAYGDLSPGTITVYASSL